jgi:hypothetical protein
LALHISRQKMQLRSTRAKIEQNLAALNSASVVLWGHLGFGDQISLAISIELWSHRVDRVIVPVKSRNLDEISKIFGYLPNVRLIGLTSDDPLAEEAEVQRIAADNSCKIIDGGRDLFYSIRNSFPEMGINRALALASTTNPESLTSNLLSQHMLTLSQLSAPRQPYAFIDHQPGVRGREIPQSLLLTVKDRGLEVIFNSMEFPLSQHALLIQSAAELHMITSAPLCLALASGSSAVIKVAYPISSELVLCNDYGSLWQEVNIGSEIPEQQSEKVLSDFDLKVRELVAGYLPYFIC